MQIRSVILATTLLSTACLAQNEIELWPGVTNFTSRGSIGNNAKGGELLQGLNTSVFTGIGDTGLVSRIDGFGMLLQDQNTDTQEDYYIVYRAGSDATGPGKRDADILCRFGPFTSPPRGTGGVVQAFNVTQSWGSAQCLRLCEYGAFGVELAQAAGTGWTSDGLSCHMSRGDGTFGQTVQFAAASAPEMAYQIIDSGSGKVVSIPSLKRSWRFRIQTSTATLQMGNGGAVYGQGGPFPDVSVPLSARARYGTAGGADLSWLFLTDKMQCPGIRIQPGMRIYLNPFYLVGPFAAGVTAGAAEHTLGTTPAASLSLVLHFQAVGINTTSGTGALTNMCSVTL